MLSLYDIAILGIVLVFALWGLQRGFIAEIFEVGGVFLGIWAGRHWGPEIYPHLPRWVPSSIALVVAAVGIGVIIFIVVKLIGWVVGKAFSIGPLKAANRLLGFGMGAVKGGLVVTVLIMIALWTPFNPYIQKARPHSPLLNWSLNRMEPFFHRKDLPFLKPHSLPPNQPHRPGV